VKIYGWVCFDQPQRAESAKATLEAEEYRVEVQSQEDDAVVLAPIPPEASLPLEALRTRLRSLAEDFGGDFLGHGESEQAVLRGHSGTLAQPTPLSPDWQRLSRFERSREPCARIAALTSASPRRVTAMGGPVRGSPPPPSLGASGRL
jgi:hypothetical protein